MKRIPSIPQCIKVRDCDGPHMRRYIAFHNCDHAVDAQKKAHPHSQGARRRARRRVALLAALRKSY